MSGCQAEQHTDAGPLWEPGTKLTYDFLQTSRQDMGEDEFSGNEHLNSMEIRAEGFMELEVGTHSLTMTMVDCQVTSEYLFGEGHGQPQISRVKRDVYESARMQGGKITESGKTRSIFFPPCIPNPQIGDTISYPITLPFQANGRLLLMDGLLTLTVTNINGELVSYATRFLCPELIVPEDVEGKFDAVQSGEGTLVYDQRIQLYREINQTITIEARMAFPKPVSPPLISTDSNTTAFVNVGEYTMVLSESHSD